jgi:outer membrane lipoprotein-sorting protein
MKKIFILFVLMMLTTTAALAQKNKVASAVQKDIDAIKKMEQEIADGFLKGNADANDKYVSENARFTAPGGMRLSRDGISTAIRSGSLKFTSSVISDLHVMVFIDTAIATYDTDDKGTFNGQNISGKARWTDTWARINGNWICVASAGTNIVEPK